MNKMDYMDYMDYMHRYELADCGRFSSIKDLEKGIGVPELTQPTVADEAWLALIQVHQPTGSIDKRTGVVKDPIHG